MSSAPGEVFTGGATTSQHVDAENEDHFENTTFKLKRTRSLGLLDEFIQPTTPADGGALKEPQHEELPSSILAQLHGLNDEQQEHEEEQAHDHAAELKVDTSNGREKCVDAIIEAPMHIKSPEMLPHDDTDIQEEPSQHVDYLSHQWDVSDISKSWRYIIQKRRDVADSARLENASWRTWAQRRSNLKTISPEAVNWSKESDVTWLYGPILKDDDHHSHDDDMDSHKRVTTATSAVAGDISLPSKSSKKCGPKPILKRRTVQDMIISHSNLLKLQLATQRLNQQKEKKREMQQQLLQQQRYERTHLRKNLDNQAPDFDDYDAISAKLNSQYTNSRNNLGTSLKGLNYSPKKAQTEQELSEDESSSETAKEASAASYGSNTAAVPGATPSTDTSINTSADTNHHTTDDQAHSTHESTEMAESPSKQDRHIHFNDEVQQCIAIEPYSDDDDDYYDDDSDEYDYDAEVGEDYVYEEGPHQTKQGDYDEDDEDDDDEDEEGGFFLRVPSSASLSAGLPGISMSSGASSDGARSTHDDGSFVLNSQATLDDAASVASGDSVRTIHMLPPTTLNHGSSDEESDDDNPYTSSLSHYVNNDSSRGYDYHYDYNTVYTVDPNHAILGSQNQRAPDVVDVPEDIAMGSNFDYDQMGHQDNSMPIIDPNLINGSNLHRLAAGSEDTPSVLPKPDYYSDSGSDSDSDDGLSIGTKTSSHSLAQLVFGVGMTNHFNDTNTNSEKNNDNLQKDTNEATDNEDKGISKQPTSSSSLSELFFGKSSGFTKLKGSQSALADDFFGTTNSGTDINSNAYNNSNNSNNSYSNNNSYNTYYNNARTNSPNYNEQIAPTQRKASPLPPQTTSANAFLGNTTPPQIIPQNNSKNTFMFDTDSESEDEFVEDVTPLNSSSGAESYAALSHVAGVNGIKSPSPDVGGGGANDPISHGGNFVGQAKGLANHFLGSWKGNGGSVDEQ